MPTPSGPAAGLARRAREIFFRIAHGGMGTAAAVLLPRVWSVLTQWTLAATTGAAAVTVYVSTTSRGSAAVSLVATALGPVLAHRKGAMRSAKGRALTGGSLAVMALAGFILTLGFESSLGLGVRAGVFTATFAAATILGGPAVIAWPLWQVRGRYFPLVGVMLVVLLGASIFALLGRPQLAVVSVGIAATVPSVALLGRVRPRRAVSYAVGVARRAVPLASMTFAAALVYPLCLQRGGTLFGATLVGQQVLFWSFTTALNITSQSLAARAITPVQSVAGKVSAFSRWLWSALALIAVGAIVYVAARWRLTSTGGASPLPVAMVISAAAFMVSDPICLFFSPPSGRRLVAIGSFIAALLVTGAVLLWPRFMIEHFSVCGPSGVIATLRLAFVTDRSLRRRVLAIMACLAAAFVLSVWVR